MEFSDEQITKGIRQGDISAFEELYRRYYVFLCLIARHIVNNASDSEEIVSDVFVKLWNNRDKTEITTSLKAYLVKAVRNTSINYIERNSFEKKQTGQLDNQDYKYLAWDSDYPLGQLYEKEILKILDEGIGKLPDACREIFMLSRNEDMKYAEIAIRLGISINTVKTQIKIALAHLRAELKNYFALILVFLLI
jgi:RNA polymerase sigma-70 factor, ECF subfamily